MECQENFRKAHRFTAQWEGGFSDVKEDRGGLTAYGVSTQFMKDLVKEGFSTFLASLDLAGPVNAALMRKITREKAEAIFRMYFWDRQNLASCPDHLACCWYDMSVNHGARQAVKLIQRGLNRALNASLTVDGIAGPLTRKAASQATLAASLAAIAARRELFALIASRNPSQKIFLKGWLNRASAQEKYIRSL